MRIPDLDVWAWAAGVLGGDERILAVKILQCCSGMFVVEMPPPLVWSVLDPRLSLGPAVGTKAATPHPGASCQPGPTPTQAALWQQVYQSSALLHVFFFKALLINQSV